MSELTMTTAQIVTRARLVRDGLREQVGGTQFDRVAVAATLLGLLIGEACGRNDPGLLIVSCVAMTRQAADLEQRSRVLFADCKGNG